MVERFLRRGAMALRASRVLRRGAWLAAGFGLAIACSKYGEGDRCEVANGSDDCSDDLVCTAAGSLPANYRQSDRCCPSDRTTATKAACQLTQNQVGGDAQPPNNSGPEAGSDAGNDAEMGDAAAGDSGGD